MICCRTRSTCCCPQTLTSSPAPSTGKSSQTRTAQRNGYRHRELDIRVGTLDVAMPKLRTGAYFPHWLLKRRKRAEAALITVVADCYLAGVSTRRMGKLVRTFDIDGLSRSQISRMAGELDEQFTIFRHRPLGEAGPSTFLAADALTMKVREGGRDQRGRSALKAGLHAVYDQPDAASVKDQFDRLLEQISERRSRSPTTSPPRVRTSWRSPRSRRR